MDAINYFSGKTHDIRMSVTAPLSDQVSAYDRVLKIGPAKNIPQRKGIIAKGYKLSI